jgi:hypothetical protein
MTPDHEISAVSYILICGRIARVDRSFSRLAAM